MLVSQQPGIKKHMQSETLISLYEPQETHFAELFLVGSHDAGSHPLLY